MSLLRNTVWMQRKRLKIGKGSFMALDLETTGLDPKTDRIVEAGWLSFNEEGINIENAFFSRIHQTQYSKSAIAIHEIRPFDTENGISEAELLQQFMANPPETIWVGHNVQFDLAMLKAVSKRLKRPWTKVRYVDTLAIAIAQARNPFYTQNEDLDLSLSALCKKAGILEEANHNALSDALASALLFLSMRLK